MSVHGNTLRNLLVVLANENTVVEKLASDDSSVKNCSILEVGRNFVMVHIGKDEWNRDCNKEKYIPISRITSITVNLDREEPEDEMEVDVTEE